MELKQFNVTVLRFDPARTADGNASERFVLPVDSPDEEHAISAAMSNCIAFTTKFENGEAKPIAFTCTAVALR